MAKDKQPKAKGVPNKHLHARVTFLYQAANYLTLRAGASEPPSAEKRAHSEHLLQAHSGLALQLGSDLQTVSQKGQVRLSCELKRTVCKTCNAVLIPGRTGTQTIENKSRGGRKPWADVVVITCTLCGSKKRFPVGAKRQKRKTERTCPQTQTEMSEKSADDQLSTVSVFQKATGESSTPG